MSDTSYEMCHVSYRGYLTHEIDAAREVLRKHGKVCADAVKELRRETDMPMSECAEMLRCLRRDMEIDRLQAENAKLRRVSGEMYDYLHGILYEHYTIVPERMCDFEERLRELGVED